MHKKQEQQQHLHKKGYIIKPFFVNSCFQVAYKQKYSLCRFYVPLGTANGNSALRVTTYLSAAYGGNLYYYKQAKKEIVLFSKKIKH